MLLLKFAALVLLGLSGVLGEYEIKYVAVIYRHGERTPIDPYPNDPYRDPSLWPAGFGELTKTGKKQHFALGTWLRSRYQGLISTEYNIKEIFVHSTDVDRTLMSAETNLAGLFPPQGKDVFEENLHWQPVPVHTKDAENDNVLGKKYCKAYEVAYSNYVHSKPYTMRLATYEGLMKYMAEQTGRKINNYVDIEYIYSTLKIEELNNLTLPNWTRPIYPDQMRDPACYSFVLETATQTLARLKVGPMLNQITKHMENVTVAGEGEDYLKMSVYSAHDNTVGNVLNALNLFDIHCPPFAATVLIELLHNNATNSTDNHNSSTSQNMVYTEEYYVRIIYRNTTGNGTVFEIPNCGTECPLSKFLKIYEHVLPKDWEEECSHGISYIILVLLVAGAVLVFMNVAFQCNLFFCKDDQSLNGKAVPNHPLLDNKSNKILF